MPKLSDAEILAKIDAKAKESYGFQSETLQAEREQALNYYLGRPYGNEIDGRSQVVTRDVLETVEWMLPSLLKIFTSGDKVVEFSPKGMEDVEQAEQETDYVNHVCLNQNDSFMTLYSWFKDALLMKVGYVKVYWDTSEDTIEDKYQNLAPEELTMLAQDPAVEIVEAEQTILGISVTLKRTNKTGKVCIDVIPPEEMLVDMATRKSDLSDANYVEHRTRKTISDIRLMGFDIADDVGTYDDTDQYDMVDTARNQYEEDASTYEGADATTRLVWFRDITMRVDENGDGIAELMRYYVVGDEILYRDACENVYYAALGPIPMPHRHVGLSIADLVMDVQLQRSSIMRQYLDGLALSNNGRYAISDRVNLDDMLVSRPGGVVRVQGMPGEGHIIPLVHPNTGAGAIEGLQYLDGQKENRTGITKYNQGLDANSLNKTASGINQIMSAAQQRMELIARVFSETGVKRMYQLVHELLKKHSDKATIYKLRNNWVPVDPRQWQTRTDMTISVGIGTGNKDAQLGHLMSIMQVQREAIQIGVATPKNIYAAAKRLAENAGFKDGDEFFTDPLTVEPQPPKPDPLMQIEQMKIQADQQKFQAESQMKQMESDKKAQLDIQKFQAQAEIDRMKAEQQMQQELARSSNDVEIERQRMMMEAELERYKAELKAQTDIQIAQIQAQIEAEKSQREAVLRAQDSERQMAMHQEKIQAMTKPKTVKRDESGRVAGVE